MSVAGNAEIAPSSRIFDGTIPNSPSYHSLLALASAARSTAIAGSSASDATAIAPARQQNSPTHPTRSTSCAVTDPCTMAPREPQPLTTPETEAASDFFVSLA